MPTIFVTSEAEGAGKTGVAAAIARHYAYLGVPTKLVRLAGSGRSAEDAAYFSSLDFAVGSPGQPGEAPQSPTNECLVVEGGPGTTTPAGATVVTVAKGDRGVGVAVASQDASFELPIDQTLAGFSVEDIHRLITAEILVEGDSPPDVSFDHLVIAPISSDAGEPYFRRFESFAVVVRFDRTDMHLAAIKGGAGMLILTGGRRPMDYLFDVATAEGVPVLLALTDTENTVIALEAIFDHTRFAGERKLDRMSALLAEAGFFEALPAIAVPAAG